MELGLLAHEYWQILASCHECIVQEDEETKQLVYQVDFNVFFKNFFF